MCVCACVCVVGGKCVFVFVCGRGECVCVGGEGSVRWFKGSKKSVSEEIVFRIIDINDFFR